MSVQNFGSVGTLQRAGPFIVQVDHNFFCPHRFLVQNNGAGPSSAKLAMEEVGAGWFAAG